MRVIATAGHVDHGKSTLVQALTGTHPDRLAEEKRRGLTIDLGFAGMRLPSGEELAFVDVPGHRRFIGNMLAGLGPAPVVMFVVAADQGWQAQSQEHLEAVDALGLQHGLLVVTRCGLADPDQIRSLRREALERMAESSLGSVTAVETDALTGLGVTALRAALNELEGSLPKVSSDASVRLWVDRSFTIKGTGTVVTGTLAAGTINVGDELELGSERVAVRSLQVLGESRHAVGPVSRVAVGLRGVSRGDVPRGTPLITPGTTALTSVIDLRRESGHGWGEASEQVSVHVGTAAVRARVRPFDELSARLTLSEPLPLRLGDRVIVRDDSSSRIHCGASVLDIDPLPLTRRGDARRRGLALAIRRVAEAEPLVQDRGYVTLSWLRRVGATHAAGPARNLVTEGIGECAGFLVSGEQARIWRECLLELVEADSTDALSRGVPVRTVVNRCDVPETLVEHLVEFAGLQLTGGRVVGTSHAANLGPAQRAINALTEALGDDPFAAPDADELTRLGLGAKELAAAAERGVLLRFRAAPADVVLLPDAPARAMRLLAALPQPFTTSQARQALGTTRRVIVPLLEHLDARGWTRREGNERSIVR